MKRTVKQMCSSVNISAPQNQGRGLHFWIPAVLITLFPLLPVMSQEYNFLDFGTDEGLPHSYVYTIVQDINGYLWIGTGNGLSRYDGFEFENYTVNDSLADNFIACGIREGKGLWFGHTNGRLSYFDGSGFESPKPLRQNPGPITQLVNRGDETWAGTYAGGILQLGEGRMIRQHKWLDAGIPVISFGFLDSKELIVGSIDGMYHCRLADSGGLEIVQRIEEIPQSRITRIAKRKDKSGYFIASATEGIYLFRRWAGEFRVSSRMKFPGLNAGDIQDIIEDSRSNLWVATFESGLMKISTSQEGSISAIQEYHPSSGYGAANVKTVFEDREGIIWSGNYGKGLSRITPRIFDLQTFDETRFGTGIYSVYTDGQIKWLGTEKGLIKQDMRTGSILAFYGNGNGIPADRVSALFSENGEKLWIGTDENGLYLLDLSSGSIQQVPIGKGSLENSVTTIAGRGGTVWIGTKKGLFEINDDDLSLRYYSISQGGLPHNYINCVYMDHEDRLWVSTRSNTLVYIRNGYLTKIPLRSTNRILILGPITGDQDSRLWIGTSGNGVLMLESDSLLIFTEDEELLSNYCYSLVCDELNNIWVGHKGGLSRIRTYDYQVKPIQLTSLTGTQYQYSLNATYRDENGKLWFGADIGLVSCDPSSENPQSLAPVTSIRSIRINDAESKIAPRIVLSPGIYKIRIDFQGISFREPRLVSYRYKFEGYEEEFVTTKNKSVTFNNLNDGSYTFLLHSVSGDGVETETPQSIEILIKTPIWKKWWFYFVISVMIFILVYLYIKKREHDLVEEKRMLEIKVAERTFEIQKQRDEIEYQKDLIDEKNADITASIEYARYIQESVLPDPQLLEELMPECFILFKPKDIVSGDFYWLTRKDGKIIFTVADGTGHGVPGAFMSLLGITLLNEIVNIKGIIYSEDILTHLRNGIIDSLRQTREDIATLDGIDLALCVWEPEKQNIQFTGAMNGLIIIRSGEIEKVKGDQSSVCYSIDNKNPFTRTEIPYNKGDLLYLYTDGYPDQFGGKHEKKYLVSKLNTKLLEIQDLDMIEQGRILDKELRDWMGEVEQTDDITVMGIRF